MTHYDERVLIAVDITCNTQHSRSVQSDPNQLSTNGITVCLKFNKLDKGIPTEVIVAIAQLLRATLLNFFVELIQEVIVNKGGSSGESKIYSFSL